MNRFLIKSFQYVAAPTLLTLGVCWLFSPFESKGVDLFTQQEVMINKNCAGVFSYLGNSDNATDWSIYVSHIKPLNPELVEDGNVGSERRCFTGNQAKDFFWDEEILDVKDGTYRKLACYNYTHLGFNAPELLTEQIYTEHEGGCRLSFTLTNRHRLSFTERLKMKLSGFYIKHIFKQNLANIKRLVEAVHEE